MWKLCLRLLLLATACLHAVTQAQMDIQIPPRKNNEGSIRLCGRYLSNMLQVVCQGNYNNMFKKSPKDSEPEYWWNEPAPADEQLPYPLKALPKASSFLHAGASNRQKRQGIYDECCRKSCKFSELRSYCGPP